jgi:hypothetical protein
MHVDFSYLCSESSLHPDSTTIRDQVTDLITNQLQYPLHIVSIDEVRRGKFRNFDEKFSLLESGSR